MTNTEIAKTILEQLGGRRFIMMTGSKDFLAVDNGLQFKIGSGAVYQDKPVSKMRIILNAMDTYDIEIFNRQGDVMAGLLNIYCDQLQTVFTKLTGMYTKL